MAKKKTKKKRKNTDSVEIKETGAECAQEASTFQHGQMNRTVPRPEQKPERNKYCKFIERTAVPVVKIGKASLPFCGAVWEHFLPLFGARYRFRLDIARCQTA